MSSTFGVADNVLWQFPIRTTTERVVPSRRKENRLTACMPERMGAILAPGKHDRDTYDAWKIRMLACSPGIDAQYLGDADMNSGLTSYLYEA